VDLTQSSKVSEAAYLAPHSEYLSAQHNEGEGYADRALNGALDGAAYDELNSERPVGGVQRPTQGPQFAGVDQGVRSAPSAGYAQSASNVSASNPNLSSNFGADWQSGLEAQAMSLLVAGHQDVWDILCRKFESTLIQTALANTRGRRIEAAQKLGIGRNTITRKIQELGLE
jgi:DNA-binding protein Fis